jgi:hypothetical protein
MSTGSDQSMTLKVSELVNRAEYFSFLAEFESIFKKWLTFDSVPILLKLLPVNRNFVFSVLFQFCNTQDRDWTFS